MHSWSVQATTGNTLVHQFCNDTGRSAFCYYALRLHVCKCVLILWTIKIHVNRTSLPLSSSWAVTLTVKSAPMALVATAQAGTNRVGVDSCRVCIIDSAKAYYNSDAVMRRCSLCRTHPSRPASTTRCMHTPRSDAADGLQFVHWHRWRLVVLEPSYRLAAADCTVFIGQEVLAHSPVSSRSRQLTPEINNFLRRTVQQCYLR